jgi:plastocyanin
MKKSPLWRIAAYVIGIAILTSATAYGALKLESQFQSGAANANTCQKKGASHIVTIKDSKVEPAHTDGKLCDTLTIKNTDDILRFIAFGQHDEHQPYDGVSEKTVEKGQEFTVTMNQAGSYKFHDHLHDEVEGTFSVK